MVVVGGGLREYKGHRIFFSDLIKMIIIQSAKAIIIIVTVPKTPTAKHRPLGKTIEMCSRIIS